MFVMFVRTAYDVCIMYYPEVSFIHTIHAIPSAQTSNNH